jgi:hypothetical protein
MKKSNKIGNEMKFQWNNSQGKDIALYQRLESEFQKKEILPPCALNAN